MHPVFELDVWSKRIGNTYLAEPVEMLASDSPGNIVATENLRELAAITPATFPSFPADRFVFALGVSPRPELTKVNGVPYRPKDKPWPLDASGQPMVFLLQFCFADSRDIFPDLPGDVLVVFVSEEESIIGTFAPFVRSHDPDCFLCEWYNFGISEVTERVNMPRSGLQFPECYTYQFRTFEYGATPETLTRAASVFDEHQLPTHPFHRMNALKTLLHSPRMKLGGIPFWYHEPPSSVQGQFLGTFSGVSPTIGYPYPWVNNEASIDFPQALQSDNFLLFGDGGCVNMFLEPNGNVACYADLSP